MDAQEINDLMREQGLNAGQLAEKLGVHPNHLRAVLRGALPLSASLAARVENYKALKASEQKAVAVSFLVSLPDGACSYHLHAPEKLADTERQQVMQAVKAKIEAESEQ